MVNGINGFIFGYPGGIGQQNSDAQNFWPGSAQWGIGDSLRHQMISGFTNESPLGRAKRMVAEAKQRHPEWEVKRLAVPLE